MALRTILVPMDGTAAGDSAMAMAFAVGAEHAAHVEVFHVRADAKSAVPLLGEGMSGAMIEEMIDLAEQEAKARAAAARKMFDAARGACQGPVVERPAVPPAAGLTLAWNETTGREDDAVAKRGRLFDLIVLGPLGDADHPSAATLHSALFETGRPVLVTPPAFAQWRVQTVAVAWNGSAEAARAIAAAMPFLKRAAKVYLLSAEEEQSSCASAGDLADHLGWHGIGAEAVCFSPAGHSTGEALLLEARKLHADLVVMGAYTHGRIMQMILGGVTRHVLAHAQVPVLMAH